MRSFVRGLGSESTLDLGSRPRLYAFACFAGYYRSAILLPFPRFTVPELQVNLRAFHTTSVKQTFGREELCQLHVSLKSALHQRRVLRTRFKKESRAPPKPYAMFAALGSKNSRSRSKRTASLNIRLI